MPVYLAKKVAPVPVAPAPFHARDLKNYAPAPVSTLGIRGVAHYREVAFQLYRVNIDAFVASTIRNERMFTGSTAYFDHMLGGGTVPLSIPDVALSPRVKLSDDQAQIALGKLGEGASMKYIGKTLEFTIQNPSFAKLQSYVSFANPNFSNSSAKLSAGGFWVYVKACSLIDGFLATHYYPAFRELDSPVPTALKMDLAASGPYDASLKDYPFMQYWDKQKNRSETVVESHSSIKRMRMSEKTVEGETEEAMDVEKYELPGGHYAVMQLPDMKDVVLTAKPSGRPSSTNFGAAGSVPASPGLLFPYFPGMTRPDPVFIRDIFIQHFFRLFGRTRDECQESFQKVKRGVGSLAGTEVGMQIAHILKGIDLALETQTRLFIIVEEDTYHGFVLLGGRFSVWDGSDWVQPLSVEDLKAEINTLDVHSVAVGVLAEELSRLRITRLGVASEVQVEELSSSMRIMSLLAARQPIPPDYDRQRINKALQSLVWSKPYSPVNPDSVASFLTASIIDKFLPDDSHPMFIPNCDSPVGVQEFQCLSMFGPDAPSFQNSSRDRQIITCIREGARKGKGKETEAIPPQPKEIYIYQKPLLTAWNDWLETVKTGSISFNSKERARAYRSHKVESPAKVKEIWEILVAGLEVKAAAEAKEPSKKKMRLTDVGVVGSAQELLDLL